MNIPLNPTEREPRQWLRWSAAIVVLVALLWATIWYAGASLATHAVDDAPALLAAAEQGKPVESATLRRAIELSPLRQSLVNAAMVAAQDDTGSVPEDRWIAALRKMGWRDTPSLQNLLVVLSARNDVDGIVDITDALLRRGKLFEESAGLLGMLEKLPDGRPYVVRMLLRRPSWRHDYLITAGTLADEESVLGRYYVLSLLLRSGDRLARDEVAPLLPALVRQGRTPEAVRLWRDFNLPGSQVSPLNDSAFQLAANSVGSDAYPAPFEWQFPFGAGFSAEPQHDGDRAYLGVNWDGRGVPIFAMQRLSGAAPGYELQVTTADQPSLIDKMLVFRLQCDDGRRADFVPVGGRSDRGLRYRAQAPCAFPQLEIAGRLQSVPMAYAATIDGVALAPTSIAKVSSAVKISHDTPYPSTGSSRS